MTKNLLLFSIINFFVAILSGASGGGGGLISTPLLVILGLSPATAIATAKFGGLGISAGTSARFYKEKYTDTELVLKLSILATVAAIIGSLILLKNADNSELLQKLMGYVILIVGIPLLYFRNMGHQSVIKSKYSIYLGYVLMFVFIILQVLLGSGIASMQMMILMGLFGMTALTASATRRAMQLIVAIISLAIFIAGGIIDYKFGIAAFVSSLLGGFVGAHIAIKKGNKFVVNMFALISAVLALELILG